MSLIPWTIRQNSTWQTTTKITRFEPIQFVVVFVVVVMVMVVVVVVVWVPMCVWGVGECVVAGCYDYELYSVFRTTYLIYAF